MSHQEIYHKTTIGTTFSIYKNNSSPLLIIFIHGVGDSHLNYLQFINHPLLSNDDILIPDIIGYGKSKRARTYFSFSQQIQALEETIQHLPKQYKKIILIPHSMGGIYAVRLAQSILKSVIKGIYAVETTVTQYGAFISEEITNLEKTQSNLTEWFDKFCNSIYKKGSKSHALRMYYAGLQLTTMQCFTQNCIEMRKLATLDTKHKFTNQIGQDFVKLDIPKVYCIAEHGQQLKSIPFLENHHIPIDTLPTDTHFCMQACPNLFIKNLYTFIKKIS